jgi:Rrf2 family nitric oxide-sensitive transcriptional repressor
MISITAEYALRAVVVLAKADEPMKTRDVADISQVPREYLAKIVQLLARGHIIESKKGRGGGICLARATTEISLYDVIKVVDPLRHYEVCPFKLSEHKGGLCPLHRRLEKLIVGVEAEFKATTLDKLVSKDRPDALCETIKKDSMESIVRTRGRDPLPSKFQ